MLRNCILILSLLVSGRALAEEITIPLSIDNEYLQALAERALFSGKDGSTELLRDESGCNSLTLREPEVNTEDDQVRIFSRTTISTGTPFGGSCFPLPEWRGYVEIFNQPGISADKTAVEFTVTDSNLFNLNMEKTLAGGALWDLAKEYVHPYMAQLVVDLHPTLLELKQLLPLFVNTGDTDSLQNMLDSMQLVYARVNDNKLETAIRIDIPTRVSESHFDESALSQQEMEMLSESISQWDAFLTFVVKQVAASTTDPELRQALFDVLVDARYELVAVLTGNSESGQDPVRRLFLNAWEALSPVMKEINKNLPGEQVLQYIAFITASDALQAIDNLGPVTDWEISVDGLRRLARMIVEDETIDPLHFDESTDREIQNLFDLGLPPPDPKSEAEPKNNTKIESGWLNWVVRPGYTDVTNPATITALNKMVPNNQNLDEYLPLVRNLLYETIQHTLEHKSLEPEYQELFRPLVLSTAWQETCWRQYTKYGSELTTIRSPAGAVGMMQIMPRVWRGFYDTTALEDNIAYNAAAGTEILLHYLVRYAISKGEHIETGNFDNLARATYSAYNGGPRHLRRYREADTSESLQEIDAAFWDKYRTVVSGNELGVAACFNA